MKVSIFSFAIACALAGGALAQTSDQRPAPDPLTVKPLESQDQSADASQIRSKIEKIGYTDIQNLSRDSAGIWHAKAKKDNEVLDIAVDKGGRIKPLTR